MDTFKPIHIVSLAVVAYNEESNIESLLEDLIQQDFPHERLEILLIDGLSTDSTKSILQKFAASNSETGRGFAAVRVLDNPKRVQAAGWNLAIQEYTGDALIRVDAHAHIPSDFVRQSVAVLDEGKMVCGGVRPTVVPEKDRSNWTGVLHLAEESAFGSSVADYRRDGAAREVSSLFHAAYRREVLARVKGFNEQLLRTEDNDFHYRIREAGYKIWLDPRIYSEQFVRTSLKRMLKQKYGNGYWVGRTLFVQPKCLEIYHFAPFALVAGAILVTFLGFFATWIPFFVCAGLYVALCVGLAVKAALECEDHSIVLGALPFVFMGIHLSYGWGTLRGLLEGLFAEKGKGAV